ncbi:hypothetical protein AYI69_g1109 [Smittium culicis]|uniref:Uncharacterized protein n=1 Tax=Smittium culicis TaxID=133412 RepID=A0A1R1YR65_9FUNG|nr:hypothetical protein AYI69_g1109 [Smittium culicis]
MKTAISGLLLAGSIFSSAFATPTATNPGYSVSASSAAPYYGSKTATTSDSVIATSKYSAVNDKSKYSNLESAVGDSDWKKSGSMEKDSEKVENKDSKGQSNAGDS